MTPHRASRRVPQAEILKGKTKKLTGLSKYGLAKYLRSLKKRGLIERDGWQKFKVTAHGISYLKQAGLGS